MLTFDYPARVQVAVALLVLCAFVSSVIRLQGEMMALDLKLVGDDEVTLYEKRFEGLGKVLPPHAVVGYVSEIQTWSVLVDANAVKQYYLTQYALAPVIVVNNPNLELVVANFSNPNSVSELPMTRGFVVLEDFGDGVALLKREAK